MKASYNWLRKLVPQLTATPQELGDRLTALGLEVEGILHYGEASAACIVAKVVSIRPHPAKSGLRLVTVDVGGGPAQEIVCGAPNVPEPGGLVVLAPLGTRLPAVNITIARRDIGGVASEGMLCSENELGLSSDSSGILVLPRGSASAGAPLLAAIPEAADHILEIGLTPNRADCLGHVGIAREIAAAYGFAFAPAAAARNAAGESREAAEFGVHMAVEDAARCPHYAAAIAYDVKVGPSPLWLRYRLSSLGVRPISNLVDLTNLIMFEWGHPLHAFDLDKLQPAANGAHIVVRLAAEGEQLHTLDAVQRTLGVDDLVICDGSGPIAIAGVMGGKATEVTEATTRVLIEVANFDPRSVRRTARRQGLHSEASHRFERGVDPDAIAAVLAAASGWLQRLGAGKSANGTLHVAKPAAAAKPIALRVARVTRMLGISISAAEIATSLQRLGCVVQSQDESAMQVLAPSHRRDLALEIDLIEEVIRLRGIDTLPTVLPAVAPSPDMGGREAFAEHVRRVCASLGLSETILLGMSSPEALAKVGAPPAAVVLRNALSERAGVLRTSLLPGLFACITQAAHHGVRSAALFALGPVFLPTSASSASPGLPTEAMTLTVMLVGDRPTHLRKGVAFDLWDVKGLCELLVAQLTGRAPTFAAADGANTYHPRGRARVLVGAAEIGLMGVLHPDVADQVDLALPAMLLELNLEAVRALGVQLPRYHALPRFPASSRDLAIVVRETVTAGEVVAVIRETAGELAEYAEVFDRFEGGQVAAGHVSLAFHVRYRLADRTLTDAEVDARHQLVVAQVEAQFGAQLRG